MSITIGISLIPSILDKYFFITVGFSLQTLTHNNDDVGLTCRLQVAQCWPPPVRMPGFMRFTIDLDERKSRIHKGCILKIDFGAGGATVGFFLGEGIAGAEIGLPPNLSRSGSERLGWALEDFSESFQTSLYAKACLKNTFEGTARAHIASCMRNYPEAGGGFAI
jgi:hypothetical protein